MITYDLSLRTGEPKYTYLYRCIRDDIRSGVLLRGTRLPSKRALADHLSVSVSTVEHAYDLLVSEGYALARPGSGFFVSRGVDERSAQPSEDQVQKSHALDDAESHGESTDSSEDEDSLIDFKANKCSMHLFPADTWARIMRRQLSEESPVLFETVPYNGLRVLRTAIASYLLEFRGIKASPDNIIVGAGTEYLYGRLLQLFGRNVAIAIGDPGYKKLADVSRSFGTMWDYIPTDDEGMLVDELENRPADLVHVSPANHFPMGVVMSAARRSQLLDWVRQSSKRYIIEDDYDSELRFGNRTFPPLFTRDETNSVIYLNTFSKTMVPSIRIAYMILPDSLMNLYEQQLSFYSCTVSSFEQCALAEFITGGYFERHINRLRRYYGKQRTAIVEAIQNSDLMEVSDPHTVEVGTHLLLDVRTRLSDTQIRNAARERGMNLAMLSDYSMHPTLRDNQCVVINFASIEPGQIQRAVDLLTDVFADDIKRARDLNARIEKPY